MSDPIRADANLEQFAYDNRIVRNFVMATLLWGVVGLLVGVIIALQLVLPKLNFDLPWLSYGRLRPLHTNAVIFAFAGNAIFAGIYYSTQRLLKARMWQDSLSKVHFWGWQTIIVLAAITLPLGITSSKEYAELEWPIDILIALVWIAFGANLFGTIFKRRERHIYVAIWFYIATWAAITLLHVVNSLCLPISLTKSYPVYAGVQDALVQWWYGHNAVAFFLTTPFLGLMYYFLPKAAERPVYSYRLSIVHFWSLIFLYIWAGPHHLLNQATPEWAQTLAVVFSVMLLAPSWGGMINGLLTLRGAWDKVRTSPVLKFYVAAVTFYGMATFEGPLLSLREVNALSHNTDWTIGHVHSGALGWNGLLVFGMVYWLVPRMWKVKLHSDGLANLHFWLCTTGITLYAVALWVSGILQGSMQLAFDDKGMLVYRDWIEIIKYSNISWWVRVFAGVLYISGALVCVYNIWRTLRGAPKLEDDRAEAPALVPDSQVGPFIDGALDQPGPRAKINAFHALLERWPLVFIVFTAIALAIGSVCELLPHMVQGALTPRIASVQPYTPLELTGRDIYIREGCVGCHTQMIRTLRAEVERYKDPAADKGEYTRAGEHIYDRPFLWGSKRTGPDLAREGLIRPSASWHYFHMLDPNGFIGNPDPPTPMPTYGWLHRDDMDLSDVGRKLAVLAGPPVYTPYSKEQVAGAEKDARAQAERIAAELRKQPRLADSKDLEKKEIIALIAYLQRLGTDLGKNGGK
ncbi:MAG: cytochrome-c oxidase, cbb3-type subunit I [Planctomycetes bacterium]|nr:cytochrome-c oxidase, cbb3-type subunit I [Planctomycetota bacterium]